MANAKVVSIYFLLCAFATCQFALAKPLEFRSLSGGKLSPKLMAALSKQHNNQLAVKPDRAPERLSDRLSTLSLRDLIASQKAYYPNEESEARQMLEESASSQYSPLEQLMAQIVADYESNNNNNNEDYYQDPFNSDSGLYYTDGQEGSFLDGPVNPHVEQIEPEDELGQAIFNYIADHYKLDQNEEEEDSNVEKRRQKIVIKDDFAEMPSTASPPVASTASPRMAKLVRKPMKVTHRGQKEVPLLRPAEIKPKEWPTELEESNLSEEESLKELPMRGQSRPVRDVLTSQLDGLKAEAQLKGAVPNEKGTKKQD